MLKCRDTSTGVDTMVKFEFQKHIGFEFKWFLGEPRTI